MNLAIRLAGARACNAVKCKDEDWESGEKEERKTEKCENISGNIVILERLSSV